MKNITNKAFIILIVFCMLVTWAPITLAEEDNHAEVLIQEIEGNETINQNVNTEHLGIDASQEEYDDNIELSENNIHEERNNQVENDESVDLEIDNKEISSYSIDFMSATYLSLEDAKNIKIADFKLFHICSLFLIIFCHLMKTVCKR